MANRRTLSMKKYDISTNKYQELFYFCKQYQERETAVNSLNKVFAVVCNQNEKEKQTEDTEAGKVNCE